ncbi:MAG: SDR family oxidoreductase [Gammaproteobacteria bacterium]|nr:SDR family oxidoreductase [Gammaproteobacteria bacterium]
MKKKWALITGANRGIGLGFVERHLKDGYQVIATCRTPDKADILQALKTAGEPIEILPLDVADDNQIFALAATMKERTIDRLILSAGIYGDRQVGLEPLAPTNMYKTFQTNTFAPIALATHLVELVKHSEERLVIAITSKVSSIADNRSGGRYAYRGSKAALNAMMFSFGRDSEALGIKTLILHPGWVKTPMGGPKALIDVETSVNGMVSVMNQADQYRNGAFIGFDGIEVPW